MIYNKDYRVDDGKEMKGADDVNVEWYLGNYFTLNNVLKPYNAAIVI